MISNTHSGDPENHLEEGHGHFDCFYFLLPTWTPYLWLKNKILNLSILSVLFCFIFSKEKYSDTSVHEINSFYESGKDDSTCVGVEKMATFVLVILCSYQTKTSFGKHFCLWTKLFLNRSIIMLRHHCILMRI